MAFTSNSGSVDDGVHANAEVSVNSGKDCGSLNVARCRCFEELIKLLTQARKFSRKSSSDSRRHGPHQTMKVGLRRVSASSLNSGKMVAVSGLDRATLAASITAAVSSFRRSLFAAHTAGQCDHLSGPAFRLGENDPDQSGTMGRIRSSESTSSERVVRW